MLQKLKPFVKWAGGKRQLLSEIQKLLPSDIDNRVYYEPFVGAGALFFNLAPHIAVINDSNSELMQCYTVIRNNAGDLITALREHEALYSTEYYYKMRALKTENLNDIEKAARFIFLNKTCYNGLYRVNSKGVFNVPVGRHKTHNICEESLLRSVSDYLNTAEVSIINTDFAEAVLKADRNSYVYFDPPYHKTVNTGFTSYQARGFDESEQIRLRDVFLSLSERGIPCLLSNADTAFIRDLYRNDAFLITSVTARRAINSDHGGRGKVSEVLIQNY